MRILILIIASLILAGCSSGRQLHETAAEIVTETVAAEAESDASEQSTVNEVITEGTEYYENFRIAMMAVNRMRYISPCRAMKDCIFRAWA